MKAKKSLGQNFLNNKKVIRDIVDAAQIGPGDFVVEIGPGRGALTAEILGRGARLLAIEADRELIPGLQERFAAENFQVVQGDIVEFDESTLDPYVIIANIPYYLTGLILRKFLESFHQPQAMTLIMQKEVADRIMVRDGKESILSISVQAYGNPSYHGKIPARYFSPKPKVDSAILRIENISKQRFVETGILEEFFFQVVKSGFAHKRKKMISNLSVLVSKEILQEIFVQLQIDVGVRAELVPVDMWFRLASHLQNRL